MPKKEPDNKGGLEFESTAYMKALDEQVSPAVKEKVAETVQETVQPQKEETESLETSDNKEVELSKEEIDWLKDKYNLVDEQRYKDSSAEGKRLHEKVEKWEQYAPLLDTIATDKGLQKHIYQYLEGGGEISKSVTDDLNLPADFVYDADEAIKNPNSPSGRVFRGEVEKAAKQLINKEIQKVRAEQEKQARDARMAIEARTFKDKFKVTDDDFNKMIDWSKSNPIDLESIYYLFTRKDRDKKVADSAIKDKIDQMKKVGTIPRSMASKGQTTPDKSEDDQVFDAILGHKKLDLFS